MLGYYYSMSEWKWPEREEQIEILKFASESDWNEHEEFWINLMHRLWPGEKECAWRCVAVKEALKEDGWLSAETAWPFKWVREVSERLARKMGLEPRYREVSPKYRKTKRAIFFARHVSQYEFLDEDDEPLSCEECLDLLQTGQRRANLNTGSRGSVWPANQSGWRPPIKPAEADQPATTTTEQTKTQGDQPCHHVQHGYDDACGYALEIGGQLADGADIEMPQFNWEYIGRKAKLDPLAIDLLVARASSRHPETWLEEKGWKPSGDIEAIRKRLMRAYPAIKEVLEGYRAHSIESSQACTIDRLVGELENAARDKIGALREHLSNDDFIRLLNAMPPCGFEKIKALEDSLSPEDYKTALRYRRLGMLVDLRLPKSMQVWEARIVTRNPTEVKAVPIGHATAEVMAKWHPDPFEGLPALRRIIDYRKVSTTRGTILLPGTVAMRLKAISEAREALPDKPKAA